MKKKRRVPSKGKQPHPGYIKEFEELNAPVRQAIREMRKDFERTKKSRKH